MQDSPSDRRSQRRVEAVVHLRVRGVDTRGEEFEELTEAADISRRGLCFITQHDLPLNSKVSILIPRLGSGSGGTGTGDFYSSAAVVSVSKDENCNRIGIRFVGATLPIYTAENS
jgi:PilZ domain